MTAKTKLPTNKNFLSPLGFQFTISKTPGVNYFVQSVNLPSLTLGNVDVPTPFKVLPFPGTRIDYGDLIITFRVDEELRNYKEIFDWITALGFPDNFEQYSSIANKAQGSGEGIVSDASLIILSSSKNPIVEVDFKNIYPYALTDLQFNTQSPGVEYIDVIANFRFQSFTLSYL